MKTITQTSLPNSKKVYIDGQLFPIKVAMREITKPDQIEFGRYRSQSPVTVYDTSGPYTDDQAVIDVRKGLPRIRNNGLDRGDVEVLEGITSEYGKKTCRYKAG
jgi:phosphomethylpyrimidine synthase